MLEFLNQIFAPKNYYKEKRQARFKRIIPQMKTSEILSYADHVENLKEDAADALFIELAKRVKNTGIPVDDWI
jgi:predicted nucleic acid-binding protein